MSAAFARLPWITVKDIVGYLSRLYDVFLVVGGPVVLFTYSIIYLHWYHCQERQRMSDIAAIDTMYAKFGIAGV